MQRNALLDAYIQSAIEDFGRGRGASYSATGALLKYVQDLEAELDQRRRSFEDQLTSNVLSAWGYTPEQIQESQEKRS